MQIVAAYEQAKNQFATWIGLSQPELHIHAGMLVFLATAVILRKPLRSPLPFLAVIAAEVLNEVADRLHSGSWRWPDTIRDVLFTLMWPLVILLLARWRKLKAS